MKKLLALLVAAGLISFGVGCGGSTTSAPKRTDTSGKPDTKPAPDTRPSTKPDAKDMGAVLTVPKDVTVKAKEKATVKVDVKRGKDAIGDIPLNIQTTAKADEIKVSGGPIPAGKDTVDLTVEAGEKEGTYSFTVSAGGDFKSGGAAKVEVKVEKK